MTSTTTDAYANLSSQGATWQQASSLKAAVDELTAGEGTPGFIAQGETAIAFDFEGDVLRVPRPGDEERGRAVGKALAIVKETGSKKLNEHLATLRSFDEETGMVLMSKLAGFNFEKLVKNEITNYHEVLNFVTKQQIQELFDNLEELLKLGLGADAKLSNLMYHKDSGFSILGTSSPEGYTLADYNSVLVQEKRLFIRSLRQALRKASVDQREYVQALTGLLDRAVAALPEEPS